MENYPLLENNQYPKVFLEELMQFALEQAEEGLKNDEVPVGCIFVEIKDNNEYEILAKAYNKTNQTKNAINHCEIICIQKIQNEMKEKSFKNLTLFVTVEPCIMCAYALNLVGIKQVYFGCYNDKFGGNGSILKLNEKPPNPYEITGHILEDKCIAILQQFFLIGNKNIPEEKRNRKKKLKQA